MAITGTGTKDDPYIVHNYDELKEKYTEQNGSTTEWYIKLVNDIDCNDFGDSWEWTAMERGYGNKYIDLDNHTIKNIMIKSGSSLFSDSNGSTHISNGKILNVFNNGATNIFNRVTLYDVSISINGTNVIGSVMNDVSMRSCSIYIKSAKLNDNCMYLNYERTYKNNDFYFDITDMNTKNLILFNNTYYMGSLDNCRIRGIVKGKITDNFICGRANLNNCVVEVDNSQATYDALPEAITSGTGVFNTEIGIYKESVSSMMLCTTAQMRDADYLNSIGFTVVKVGE